MWYYKKEGKCLLNLEQSDIENNNFEKQTNVGSEKVGMSMHGDSNFRIWVQFFLDHKGSSSSTGLNKLFMIWVLIF